MPGFYGEINNNRIPRNYSEKLDENLINRSLETGDLYIEQRTINKFLNDKLIAENESFAVLTEGVILNIQDLKEKYRSNNWLDTIINMYLLNGASFFNEFRGSFSGIFYDKKNNTKIIFTDHIGDKQVFFSQIEDTLVFGSEINYLIEYYKRNQLNYKLNKEAVYYILTYGYLLEDNTLISGIKKLIPGSYILIENDKTEIIQYYKVNNIPNYNQTEEEIIENIDFLFRQAVNRAFQKDLEYGYKHLVGLSGGLDSRMTTWVANDLGFGNNILNFTFSQSNYLDETIAKKISSDLKHEWIFKSLDNGLFLKNIEEVIKISSGGSIYSGAAHGKSCLDLIDVNKFGIVHSGQLGDVVIGTFSTSKEYKDYSIDDGVYSDKLIKRLDKNKIKYSYENEEIFKLYQRGFSGANQGLLAIQEKTETFSPFYDIDFLQYCLNIPVEYRLKHKIYFQWIIKKYPLAAKYKWESLNAKITDKQVKILGRNVFIKQIPKKILNKYFKSNNEMDTKNHMNPFDYWYRTNKDLKKFMDDYYHNNIFRLKFDDELFRDCEYLYFKGNNIEKNQVLTILAFMKIYFGEKNEK